jgi:hypothetical protein
LNKEKNSYKLSASASLRDILFKQIKQRKNNYKLSASAFLRDILFKQIKQRNKTTVS